MLTLGCPGWGAGKKGHDAPPTPEVIQAPQAEELAPEQGRVSGAWRPGSDEPSGRRVGCPAAPEAWEDGGWSVVR